MANHIDLLKQSRNAQQQACGNKSGDQRGKNGGKLAQKALYRTGLLALHLLFLLRGNGGEIRLAHCRRHVIARFNQSIHHICGRLCFTGTEDDLQLRVTFNHAHHSRNFFQCRMIGERRIIQR
ncbi:Uncharacterised protein [Vibrio cholerae]|uniref:Uncharacterized protein n=1 Tax=Vibrio cholerae TaxID=666 RepID=A0A655YTQ2_VIBCL|nr:Uncharacterised protein [Vibrio cholerae]